MIKPEDLLNAYDHLCLYAKQQIETIFTQKHQAELAAAFCNNWSYFMTPDTFSSAPKTLNNAQKILDMADKPVKLQDIAARLDESHEFLRLSHLLLDYSKAAVFPMQQEVFGLSVQQEPHTVASLEEHNIAPEKS